MEKLGSNCYRRNTNTIAQSSSPQPQTFSLPAPIPQWPQGQGFASGLVNLGEIEVFKASRLEFIWSSSGMLDTKKGVTFYKPVGVPDCFRILGHYCQPSDKPVRGFVLVAREVETCLPETAVIYNPDKLPPLKNPLDFKLVWNQDAGSQENSSVYFWQSQAPEVYNCPWLLDFSFEVWSLRPCERGMLGKGISVGTFLCSSGCTMGQELPVACLKNQNPVLSAMPNLQQIHALIRHYGPTGESKGEEIDSTGSNLPGGGTNDGQFWIDLPSDDRKDFLKRGELKSARLYVHVKPALGGTFTDIAMWVFCPFNGPATLKIGIKNIPLSKIGEHVGDWEHFTMRICNFSGELYSIYFSQHSGGEWVDAYDLDYIEGKKAIVYSSKCGHASYPRPGTYIQGSSKLGIGIRNDAARSFFMREWGPKIVYDSKTELDKMINALPHLLRYSMKNLFDKFPGELYGEEGPTGPKEKNNWLLDERWWMKDGG
ncbi:hypothetical protein VNO77_35816 [Canavalia gladiata]|uniref:Uncharacterized protein n=1 Tax=Canavalia gladiata TaxID=3824 RepID=A0AAN9KAC7_CANGL